MQRKVEVRSVNHMQAYVPKDIQHATVVSVPPPVMPTVVAADDALRKEMREVVDLMKNISLNLLSNGGANQGQNKPFNQATCDHPQHKHNHGQSGGKGWRFTPTCSNCGELGHISPQCDKPSRMGGDMYPLPTQLPNKSNDYGIEIKGEAGSSGLTQEEKGKTKVLNVVCFEEATM